MPTCHVLLRKVQMCSDRTTQAKQVQSPSMLRHTREGLAPGQQMPARRQAKSAHMSPGPLHGPLSPPGPCCYWPQDSWVSQKGQASKLALEAVCLAHGAAQGLSVSEVGPVQSSGHLTCPCEPGGPVRLVTQRLLHLGAQRPEADVLLLQQSQGNERTST